MSRNKHAALVTSVVLVCGVAMVNGCTTTTIVEVAADSGVESGVIVTHKDAAASGSSSGGTDASGDSTSGDDTSGVVYDGTTGQQCTTDADCLSTNPGAPGLVRCSLANVFSGGAVYPTGVCLLTVGCSIPDDTAHFCDGPDEQSSPGLCVPLSSGATTGDCFPKCTFSSDASAPVGCVGKDACNPYEFGEDTSSSTAEGLGFCYGGCEVDADCPSGNACQSNFGVCVTTPDAQSVQDPEGQDCSTASDACNCTGSPGFCALNCKTAGSVSCPTGQVCDAFLPTSLTTGTGTTIPGWTAQNPGLAGICLPTCALDGGAGTEAGACYANSTCTAVTVKGPDCEP
jgi:hypothetical protein